MIPITKFRADGTKKEYATLAEYYADTSEDSPAIEFKKVQVLSAIGTLKEQFPNAI